MDLPVPGTGQAWKHDRFLSLANTEREGCKRFLGKALNGLEDWEKPSVINTDKVPTYGIAISELKAKGKCPEKTVHRQVKYLNNVVEADHGRLKHDPSSERLQDAEDCLRVHHGV
jgi:transposase-like protein